jgi:hypothetical protein
MTAIRPGPAEGSFKLGLALLLGQATAGPDDPFESARGAFISAIVANDPEWSPRAAYTLAHALLDRRDLVEAHQYAALAQQSGHPEWSTGGVLVKAHLNALSAIGPYRPQPWRNPQAHSHATPSPSRSSVRL